MGCGRKRHLPSGVKMRFRFGDHFGATPNAQRPNGRRGPPRSPLTAAAAEIPDRGFIEFRLLENRPSGGGLDHRADGAIEQGLTSAGMSQPTREMDSRLQQIKAAASLADGGPAAFPLPESPVQAADSSSARQLWLARSRLCLQLDRNSNESGSTNFGFVGAPARPTGPGAPAPCERPASLPKSLEHKS